MLLTPAQIKSKSFESRRNFFLTGSGCISCLSACLGARLLSQSYQYPDSKHWFTTAFPQPLPYFYAIGSRKLSANQQFFVGAQTVVSLLQRTQIKQCVSFIAANKVYTSTNKTTIIWIETELSFFFFFFFFLPGVDASHVYVRALALGYFPSHISTRTFRRALAASLDSCAEIKSTPSAA